MVSKISYLIESIKRKSTLQKWVNEQKELAKKLAYEHRDTIYKQELEDDIKRLDYILPLWEKFKKLRKKSTDYDVLINIDRKGYITLQITFPITKEELDKADESKSNYIKKNGKNSYHIYSDGGEKGDNTLADIDNVRNLIEGRMDADKGAFQVDYDEFGKIYDFVSRCVERKQQMVQTVLFSITAKADHYLEVETMDKAMGALREAVKGSLRSVDVGTQYSSSQYVLILLDADLDNGKMVVERVREQFYQIYKEDDLNLSYDMQTMKPRMK